MSPTTPNQLFKVLPVLLILLDPGALASAHEEPDGVPLPRVDGPATPEAPEVGRPTAPVAWAGRNRAIPWAPVTHLHLAEVALQDAVADGRVTICLVDGEEIVGHAGDYRVSPAILRALERQPEHFRAGVLGPDAYPDIATGQRVIHPNVGRPSPTTWRPGLEGDLEGQSSGGTDAWLSYLWQDAFAQEFGWPGQTGEAWRAFAVGYLVHAAGDMFGHTYVNYFTGGPFELGENAAKHITIERLIGERTPMPAGGVLRHAADQIWSPLYGRLVRANRNEVLRESLLVGDDAAQVSIPRIFSDIRNQLESEIEAYLREDGVVYKIAYAGADEYMRAWVADIDDGLRAWPQISHEISKAAFFGDAYSDVSVGEVTDHFVNRYLLSMLGFPDAVGDALGDLNALQEAIIPDAVQAEIDEMRRDLFNWLIVKATGMTWEQIKDPEEFFDEVVGAGGGRHISLTAFDMQELGFGRVQAALPGGGGACAGAVPRTNGQGFDYRAFPPAYNTVVMTKLAFLDRDEANRLLADLGASARLETPNAMLGFVTSLDDSNQWLDGSQMAFARERDVFRKIFMTQRGEDPSRGVIAGRVTVVSMDEENGEPLANVRAEVYRDGPDGEEEFVRFGGTDADGRYRVEWLAEGPHHVHFEPPTPDYVDEWWDDQEDRRERTPVPVTYDGPADSIDAALYKPPATMTAGENEETDDIALDALCSGSVMMSAVPPDFRDYHEYVPPSSAPVVAALNPGFLAGEGNPFAVWEDQERRLVADGLMPLPSAFSLSGLVEDGGRACTEPVGDNFMLEAEVGMISQEDMMEKVQARMTEMMSNPAEMQEMAEMMRGGGNPDPRMQAISRSLGFPVALPPALMRDLEGSTMFELYSPNGVSWLMGSLLEPTADRPLIEHAGLAGWESNAASQLWLVLPGTPVSSLQVGASYPAILPQLGTDPLYVRTEGEWRARDPQLYQCSWKNPRDGYTRDGPFNDELSGFRDVLQGSLTVLQPEQLSGTMTVEGIADGEVTGRFELSGNATLRTEEYQFVYSNDGLANTCAYGGTGKVMRTDRTGTSEETGGITVLGTLTAPASSAVTRPGRRIGQTRIVTGGNGR